jgi:hypothetical protein
MAAGFWTGVFTGLLGGWGVACIIAIIIIVAMTPKPAKRAQPPTD